MRYEVVPTSGTDYARVLFEQSSTSVIYYRSYNRVDDFLAYVGGLISSAIAIIFIMSFYNEFSYYISIGDKLFVHDKEKYINSGSYNILLFFCHCFVKFGNMFGCCKKGSVYNYVEAEE